MASLDFEKEKAAFREFYAENQKLFLDAESFFRSLIASLILNAQTVTSPTVISRVKDREEAIKKFSRKYQSHLEETKEPYEIKDHITDLIAVRVICLYEDEMQKIAQILYNNFNVIEITDKIKALESTEDAFGYKGLHMDLKINDMRKSLPEYSPYADLLFEVQIRTIIQDAWSVLDHKIKYKKSIPARLKRKINALAAQFETADQVFVTIRNESQALEETTSVIPTKAVPSKKAPLDVFQFLAIAKELFPGYDFFPQFADGFVLEILQRNPELTFSEFCTAINETHTTVDKYKSESLYPMNPYTVIRHALYLSDRKNFHLLLFDRQRDNFEEWLNAQDNP